MDWCRETAFFGNSEKVEKKTNIVDVLWLAVGLAICGVMFATSHHVKRAKALPDDSVATILSSKQGVKLSSAQRPGWIIGSQGDKLYAGDSVITTTKGAMIDAGLGRRIEMGPSSKISFLVVTRPGSKIVDMQVILDRGYLIAEQPKTCNPCGTLLVRTPKSSFEVHRKERIGVQVMPDGKGEEFDSRRSPKFQRTQVRELRVPGVSRTTDMQIPMPVSDPNFGREWWTDKSWDTLQFATVSIPLAPPTTRPDLNTWRPFIEVSESTGLHERKFQDTSISTRPKINLRVNTILAVASPQFEDGISAADFRVRGGFTRRDPRGDKRFLGTGLSAYKIRSFGDSLVEPVTIGLDQLRPASGGTWFPAKPQIDVAKAPVQISLPKGPVPNGLGRYIRGASRVGWRGESGEGVGTMIFSKGKLLAVVRGSQSEGSAVVALRRSFGGDLAVRGTEGDIVTGTPTSIAKQVFQELAEGKSFFAARYSRATPINKSNFPNPQSLEQFLRATGNTVLRKPLPIL